MMPDQIAAALNRRPILDPRQARVLRALLRAHLPAGTQVRIFGSRATGRGLKPHSDLDLLIRPPEPLSLAVRSELREALSDSDLPFQVDILEEPSVSPAFIQRVEAEGTLPFDLFEQEAS